MASCIQIIKYWNCAVVSVSTYKRLSRIKTWFQLQQTETKDSSIHCITSKVVHLYKGLCLFAQDCCNYCIAQGCYNYCTFYIVVHSIILYTFRWHCIYLLKHQFFQNKRVSNLHLPKMIKVWCCRTFYFIFNISKFDIKSVITIIFLYSKCNWKTTYSWCEKQDWLRSVQRLLKDFVLGDGWVENLVQTTTLAQS